MQEQKRGGSVQELDYERIGIRIRQARKTKGWSQKELADKCGVSLSFLGHIERGTRIMSLNTFVNLCAALHMGAGELLWGIAYPSNYCQIDTWKQEGKAAGSYAMFTQIMQSIAEIMSSERSFRRGE